MFCKCFILHVITVLPQAPSTLYTHTDRRAVFVQPVRIFYVFIPVLLISADVPSVFSALAVWKKLLAAVRESNILDTFKRRPKNTTYLSTQLQLTMTAHTSDTIRRLTTVRVTSLKFLILYSIV